MIVNGRNLWDRSDPPIKDMLTEKCKLNGVSHGLAEAGYDIRLKQDLLFDPSQDGSRPLVMENNEHGQCVRIRSGRFTLASAIEEFHMPDDLVGVVHDKSTWARHGVSVFNTVIEPGWKGFLTLEIVFHGNSVVHLPAGSGIAQVLFHKIQNVAAYDGKYQDQPDRPVEAILAR